MSRATATKAKRSASASTAATAQSSTALSQSQSSLAARPIFLELTEQSFAHVTLQPHNFVHVFVGRVQRKLMLLPLVLHCHQSLLDSAGHQPALQSKLSQHVLSRLFSHLPSLIADVTVSRLSSVKSKATECHSDNVTFTVQFRETEPSYQIMTMIPRQARAKPVHHPFIDSEEDGSDSDDDSSSTGDDDGGDDGGDGSSDDDEWMNDDDHDDSDIYDENASGTASDTTFHRRYRAFWVSKHSLYVRAIARHENGIKLTDDGQTCDTVNEKEKAKRSSSGTLKSSPQLSSSRVPRHSPSLTSWSPTTSAPARRTESAIDDNDLDDIL